MQNYYRVGVSLEAVSLFLRGRGKTVYILPSSDPTSALLLVRFTEYDDDYYYFYLIVFMKMRHEILLI
ncbi:hypothetical protein Hanom_Chr04g00378651 [Helianthus anomalus]